MTDNNDNNDATDTDNGAVGAAINGFTCKRLFESEI